MSMTNPKEPTLTCSEVVERYCELLSECIDRAPLEPESKTELLGDICQAIQKHIPAILHSWRERLLREAAERVPYLGMKFALEDSERRVQELEEALRITSASIAKEMNRFDYEELDGSGAIITAEEVYKQSLEKAREQIRKGANHD